MSRVLPILFNTEMVRAILEGRKTVTRRVVKPRYQKNEYGFEVATNKATGQRWVNAVDDEGFMSREILPPYKLGDILYVRETWQYLYELNGNEQIIEGTGKYYYAASDTLPFDTYVDSMGATRENIPWRPSIHMPKQAARIWLKVTDVRVEQLQEITFEGCLAEGAFVYLTEGYFDRDVVEPEAKKKFGALWNSTIKKSDLDRYGWNASPWVWVIEFSRCEKPESEGMSK